MSQLKSIFFALFMALTIVACKNEKNSSNAEKSDTTEASLEQEASSKEPEIVFQKTLTLQDITFDVTTTGEGSIGELTIQPKGLEIDNQQVVLELDGQVINAEIEDLNSDGFPEILIYTTSAGSGGYGNVIGYSVNDGKSISQIYFPDIFENKEASSGYMGHDEFAIVETTLVRKFPVYKNDDTNNNPTGGTRQIEYKLNNGEASKLFVIDKISEIK
ncbi:MAG: PliI family lysozyme inhibitor of I-type lysozyme [Flavobacteriales bacterium]